MWPGEVGESAEAGLGRDLQPRGPAYTRTAHLAKGGDADCTDLVVAVPIAMDEDLLKDRRHHVAHLLFLLVELLRVGRERRGHVVLLLLLACLELLLGGTHRLQLGRDRAEVPEELHGDLAGRVADAARLGVGEDHEPLDQPGHQGFVKEDLVPYLGPSHVQRVRGQPCWDEIHNAASTARARQAVAQVGSAPY